MRKRIQFIRILKIFERPEGIDKDVAELDVLRTLEQLIASKAHEDAQTGANLVA